MPPSLSFPAGLALPAPWGVFEVLLLATFAAHLLVMNVALGGSLLAFFTAAARRPAAGTLAGPLPATVAVAVNLGIPPLLFASVLYGQYLYAAAILSAAAWVAFFMLIMAAYALLYRFQSRFTTTAGPVLAGLAALLLLGASLVMTDIATLMIRPEAWKASLGQPAGLFLNLSDPTFLPRWLHFVLASLAVAGLFVALVKSRAAGRGEAAARETMRLGLFWFTRASLAQFVVGGWFLFALPEEVRHLFLAGNASATAVLAVGLVLAILAVIHGLRGAPGRASVYTVATVCFMVAVRDLVRRACLAPHFLPEALPVAPQYGPFVMFLASFLAVSGIVVWLVAAHRRAAGRG
jgi:hypothetical protein